MNAEIFKRLTGVQWDEFHVAWRMYQAQHGARLRYLAFALMLLLIAVCALRSHLDFYALDLDGNGSLFPAYTARLGMHGRFSLLILLPLLFPLIGIFIPSSLQDSLPVHQQTVLLCARIHSIAIQLILTLITTIFLGIGNLDLASLHIDIDWLDAASHFLALAFALCTLQRFFKHDAIGNGFWKLCYLLWIAVYILIQTITWKGHYTGGNDFDNSIVVEVGSNLLPTWILPSLLLLWMMLNRRFARICFPLCCLATLYFTFVQPNVSAVLPEPNWLVPVEIAARPLVGLADHAFHYVTGIIQ
ncbi:MAG: hypothetical protein R3F46_09665 [bacterium]